MNTGSKHWIESSTYWNTSRLKTFRVALHLSSQPTISIQCFIMQHHHHRRHRHHHHLSSLCHEMHKVSTPHVIKSWQVTFTLTNLFSQLQASSLLHLPNPVQRLLQCRSRTSQYWLKPWCWRHTCDSGWRQCWR